MRIITFFILAILYTGLACAEDTALLTVDADDDTVQITLRGATDRATPIIIRPGESIELKPDDYSIYAYSDWFGTARYEKVHLSAGQSLEVALLFDFPDLVFWHSQDYEQIFDAQWSVPVNWDELLEYAASEKGKILTEFLHENSLDVSYLPELRLLVASDAIDDTEFAYWLSALPIMPLMQRAELRDILLGSHAWRFIRLHPQGEKVGELEYLEAVARMAPTSAWAQNRLANSLVCAGEISAAEQAWNRSLAIESDDIRVRNSYAWLLATTSDNRYRDGQAAQELLDGRIDVDTPYYIIDTYAAAFATQGQFEQAVYYQKIAVNAVRNAKEKSKMKQRLSFYQSQRFYVEEPVCGSLW
ncbi:MAG: hypothetical protein V3U75_08725 [Methylococcaceae bacterium]